MAEVDNIGIKINWFRPFELLLRKHNVVQPEAVIKRFPNIMSAKKRFGIVLSTRNCVVFVFFRVFRILMYYRRLNTSNFFNALTY